MKKLLAIVLAAVMALSMMSFASAEGLAGEYDITVWVAENIVDLNDFQVDEWPTTPEGEARQAAGEPMAGPCGAYRRPNDKKGRGEIPRPFDTIKLGRKPKPASLAQGCL